MLVEHDFLVIIYRAANNLIMNIEAIQVGVICIDKKLVLLCYIEDSFNYNHNGLETCAVRLHVLCLSRNKCHFKVKPVTKIALN